MPSQPNFKTAHWKGIVRPNLSRPDELTALSIRLPKELAADVFLAAHEYRCLFDSAEEVIATAVSWAIQSLTENPLSPKPRRAAKRRQT